MCIDACVEPYVYCSLHLPAYRTGTQQEPSKKGIVSHSRGVCVLLLAPLESKKAISHMIRSTVSAKCCIIVSSTFKIDCGVRISKI